MRYAEPLHASSYDLSKTRVTRSREFDHMRDRLIHHNKQPIDLRKIELVQRKRWQGRGGDEWRQGAVELGPIRAGEQFGAGPTRSAPVNRPARRCRSLAQRGEMFEAVEPSLGAVGDLADDAELDKPVEQANRVFDGDAEECCERGCRQQWGGGQQVDGQDGVESRRRPATARRASNQLCSIRRNSARPSAASAATASRKCPTQIWRCHGTSAASAAAPVSSGQGRAVRPRTTQ